MLGFFGLLGKNTHILLNQNRPQESTNEQSRSRGSSSSSNSAVSNTLEDDEIFKEKQSALEFELMHM